MTYSAWDDVREEGEDTDMALVPACADRTFAADEVECAAAAYAVEIGPMAKSYLNTMVIKFV